LLPDTPGHEVRQLDLVTGELEDATVVIVHALEGMEKLDKCLSRIDCLNSLDTVVKLPLQSFGRISNRTRRLGIMQIREVAYRDPD
jgi:hypothetical protein